MSDVQMVHRRRCKGGLGFADGRKAGLQGVTESHQGIDLGDDAVLFGEGRDSNRYRFYFSRRDMRNAIASAWVNTLCECW